VPTADGEEQIEIKPGTQAGSEIRLRGRGVPHLRRPATRGDVHVLVDLRVPARLSARQRELLEQLAVELGDGETDEPAAPADAADGAVRRPKDGRRRARRPGLRDRLRDAIN
jgi:DnaJ-class molecular chaperone